MLPESVLAWLTAGLFALAAITWVYCFILLSARIQHDYQQEYVQKLQRNLTELWLFIPLQQLLALWLLTSLCVVVILFVLNVHWGWICGALLLVTVTPGLLLHGLRRSRRHTFLKQLPDALMLLANSVATGASLQRSVEFVSREMPPPLGQEFSLVVRQLRLGQSIPLALQSLHQRMPNGDVQRVILTLELTQQVGGQQARILRRCAQSLRKKLSLQQRIESISAQGRLQGKVMSFLPLLLVVVFAWMESHAMSMLREHPVGWALIFLLVLLLVLGQWWIARLVKITVPL